MDQTLMSSITTQPTDRREASPRDEADFMRGAEDPARAETMKGILGFLATGPREPDATISKEDIVLGYNPQA
jgi:hypothetical protein